MTGWDGTERRLHHQCPHDIDRIIDEAVKRGAKQGAKEGAKEVLIELGVYDEDDKKFLKDFMSFFRGTKVGRRVVMWLSGVATGIGVLLYGINEFFRR